MRAGHPRYTKEEAGRRGDEIYDHQIRSQVEPHHNGEVVAIDLYTGDWEVDPDEITAAQRLKARQPHAQVWVVHAGSRYLARFGVGRRTQV